MDFLTKLLLLKESVSIYVQQVFMQILTQEYAEQHAWLHYCLPMILLGDALTTASIHLLILVIRDVRMFAYQTVTQAPTTQPICVSQYVHNYQTTTGKLMYVSFTARFLVILPIH